MLKLGKWVLEYNKAFVLSRCRSALQHMESLWLAKGVFAFLALIKALSWGLYICNFLLCSRANPRKFWLFLEVKEGEFVCFWIWLWKEKDRSHEMFDCLVMVSKFMVIWCYLLDLTQLLILLLRRHPKIRGDGRVRGKLAKNEAIGSQNERAVSVQMHHESVCEAWGSWFQWF